MTHPEQVAEFFDLHLGKLMDSSFLDIVNLN